MRNILIAAVFLGALSSGVYANGVGIIDAYDAVYLHMDSTVVDVSVQSQISVTTTTQYYTNKQTGSSIKYGFPLSEQASAIGLRWEVEGQWYTAEIASAVQDTTLPGDGGGGGNTPDQNLTAYLGQTPLYFSIPQAIKSDSTLTVELTYVELLPYAFGNVSYSYPNNYQTIQPEFINIQRLDFSLESPRSIEDIQILSNHFAEEVSNTGNTASVRIVQYETPADEDYSIQYSLNASQLGLFAYSTWQPDSLVSDTYGNGFLTFIAEPDAGSTSDTISKVFTLIIDRSGSMSGDKIIQARDAATYIVQNLNPGDMFNLVDFSTDVRSFRTQHVEYTTEERDAAIEYISTFIASGGTNISGAFETAIPQFNVTDNTTANIVIFLTDGNPTVNIENTQELVGYIDDLINTTETNVFLFNFGIGSDVNKQLLSLMSSHNNGFTEFLGNDELYDRITSFYRTIRDPVLLNSEISFSPPVISEAYPDSLPNLYKGKQMIVTGRYNESVPVQITLSGTAFGQPVSYNYDIQLANSTIQSYQFLPKLWAKQIIESLLIRYYILNPDNSTAIELKEQIIALSQTYGIISPFTSFTQQTNDDDNGNVSVEEETPADCFDLLGNYPNPFNPSTSIRVRFNTDYAGPIEIKIFNINGQLVRVLRVQVNGRGIYNFVWDGLSELGTRVASGIYFYSVISQNMILVGKMSLLK